MSQNNRERIHQAIQAAFETMETRRLLSTVQVADGVLIIDADPHTASNIIVDFHAPGGRIRGYAAGVEATYSVDEVKSVRITGGDGDDNVFIDSGVRLPTLIRTGAGNDRVRGGSGVDTVDAGTGNDEVHGGRGNDRLSGGEGSDVIHGNVGHDVVDGGAGDDELYGQDGDDTIYGGEGFDLLAGQGGDDKIYGNEGDDRLSGGTDHDALFGGDGDDVLEAHSGSDELVGGTGIDTIRGGAGKNKVRVEGGNGNRAPAGLTEAPDVANPPAGNNGGGTPAPAPAPVPAPPPPANHLPDPGPDAGNGGNGGDVGSTPPDAGKTPRPVIKMIGDADLVVGQTVHVHGLDSVLNGGSAVTSRYEWDFGDTSGRYNQLRGFNAAHVYDKPGVYTIALTVTNDAGRKGVATVKVNVAADERPTIYVDSKAGDDDNDGSSPSNAVRTAAKAFEIAGDDTRVLFKRGQRFTIEHGITISEDRVLVGAYGSGDLPVLYRVEGSGVGDAVFRTSESAEDVTFEDLRFDSEYKADADGAAPKIPATAVYAGGTKITVRDVEFVNVGNGVNANQKPTGLLVMDSEATQAYGTRSYFVWGQGTDLVVLGNTSADSSREHNLRTSGVERILVAHNNFAQTDRKAEDPSDMQKGCIEIHRGLYAYIVDNAVHGGVIRTGPRGAGAEPADTETAWVVIEDNRLDDVGIKLYAGSHHVMIRNNVIERYESIRHGSAISISAPDRDNRVSGDIYVLNNTGIERRVGSGKFLDLEGPAQPGSITVKNNLWVNANMRSGSYGSSGMYVSEDSLASFREISGNVWATAKSSTEWAGGGTNYVGATWGKRGAYRSAAEWNAMPEVGTDYFTNDISLNDIFQVRLNQTTAGSTLSRAA